jgi:hypothetical protein
MLENPGNDPRTPYTVYLDKRGILYRMLVAFIPITPGTPQETMSESPAFSSGHHFRLLALMAEKKVELCCASVTSADSVEKHRGKNCSYPETSLPVFYRRGGVCWNLSGSM